MRRSEASRRRVSFQAREQTRWDNAMAESFFVSLQTELLDRRTFQSRPEARIAVFDYIEDWYDPHRRHSSIGKMSPVNFERVLAA